MLILFWQQGFLDEIPDPFLPPHRDQHWPELWGGLEMNKWALQSGNKKSFEFLWTTCQSKKDSKPSKRIQIFSKGKFGCCVEAVTKEKLPTYKENIPGRNKEKDTQKHTQTQRNTQSRQPHGATKHLNRGKNSVTSHIISNFRSVAVSTLSSMSKQKMP